jgi:hypothetical protein
MPLLKTRTPVPQLTAAGSSVAVSVAPSYRHSVYVRHANGTGAITAGALVKVQVRPQGSAAWFDLLSLAFGTTAAPAPASAETRVVPLPDDAAEARLEYAVPTGSSGHTLDAEIGQITAY